MTPDFASQVMYNGVINVLLLSLPCVGVGMLVGFIISLFQAVTQIQEQTLTFVPKVVAVFGMLIIISPWMISLLLNFTLTLWSNIPQMVR